MVWREIIFNGDEIALEVESAVNLSGVPLNGTYVGRAKTLAGRYVRRGSDTNLVLIRADSDDVALDMLTEAVQAGVMVPPEA